MSKPRSGWKGRLLVTAAIFAATVPLSSALAQTRELHGRAPRPGRGRRWAKRRSRSRARRSARFRVTMARFTIAGAPDGAADARRPPHRLQADRARGRRRRKRCADRARARRAAPRADGHHGPGDGRQEGERRRTMWRSWTRRSSARCRRPRCSRTCRARWPAPTFNPTAARRAAACRSSSAASRRSSGPAIRCSSSMASSSAMRRSQPGPNMITQASGRLGIAVERRQRDQPPLRPGSERHREHRGPQGRIGGRDLRVAGGQRRGRHHDQAGPRRQAGNPHRPEVRLLRRCRTRSASGIFTSDTAASDAFGANGGDAVAARLFYNHETELAGYTAAVLRDEPERQRGVGEHAVLRLRAQRARRRDHSEHVLQQAVRQREGQPT